MVRDSLELTPATSTAAPTTVNFQSYKQYSEASLKQAISAVLDSGMRATDAATHFGIPLTTLTRKVRFHKESIRCPGPPSSAPFCVQKSWHWWRDDHPVEVLDLFTTRLYNSFLNAFISLALWMCVQNLVQMKTAAILNVLPIWSTRTSVGLRSFNCPRLTLASWPRSHIPEVEVPGR